MGIKSPDPRYLRGSNISLFDALHSVVASGRPVSSRSLVHHFFGGQYRCFGIQKSKRYLRARQLSTCLHVKCPTHLSLFYHSWYCCICIRGISQCFVFNSVAQLYSRDDSKMLPVYSILRTLSSIPRLIKLKLELQKDKRFVKSHFQSLACFLLLQDDLQSTKGRWFQQYSSSRVVGGIRDYAYRNTNTSLLSRTIA